MVKNRFSRFQASKGNCYFQHIVKTVRSSKLVKSQNWSNLLKQFKQSQNETYDFQIDQNISQRVKASQGGSKGLKV